MDCIIRRLSDGAMSLILPPAAISGKLSEKLSEKLFAIERRMQVRYLSYVSRDVTLVFLLRKELGSRYGWNHCDSTVVFVSVMRKEVFFFFSKVVSEWYLLSSCNTVKRFLYINYYGRARSTAYLFLAD